MSGDLVAFIAARLDEDEAAAREAVAENRETWKPVIMLAREEGRIVDEDGMPVAWTMAAAATEHIARHDPARAFREIATWRWLLLEYSIPPGADAVYGHTERETGFRFALSAALKAKALEWKDHPDYRDWAPSDSPDAPEVTDRRDDPALCLVNRISVHFTWK